MTQPIASHSKKLRSSRPEVFCKKGVLRKTPGPEPPETLAQVFSCEFCKISKNNFSYRPPPVAASKGSIQETHDSSFPVRD